MDAFWCIVLSTIALRWWWKRNRPLEKDEVIEPPKLNVEEAQKMQDDIKARNAQKEVDDQKERDIAELKKQGYSDELIAVILPTINNDK